MGSHAPKVHINPYEDADSEQGTSHASPSFPSCGSAPSDSSSSRLYSRDFPHSTLSQRSSNISFSSQSDKAYDSTYNRFIRRYRPSLAVEDESRHDADNHYHLNRGFRQMLGRDDNGDSDSDESRASSFGSRRSSFDRLPTIPSDPELEPQTLEEEHRVEWQSLLACVLAGDSLISENTRFFAAMRSSMNGDNNLRTNLWLGIRAKIHGRSVAEEEQRLKERRLSILSPADHALMQVEAILRKLDIVYSLFPSVRSLYTNYPAAMDADFQARCDTLNTWSTVITSLRQQISLLQDWTGSKTLNVSHTNNPGTSSFPDLHGGGSNGTPFVERLLKDEAMQIQFEKGSMTTISALVSTTRDAHVNLASMFQKMNLPAFEQELVPLVSFLTNLARAVLRVRLDYAQKLQNPDILIIDQMTEDLRLKIGFACALKQQCKAFLQPDPGGYWRLPPCISDDYDSVVLEALDFFFKLIHWKLKSGTKAIYFKETDIIEMQWATFSDVSLVIPGGATRVAEQICSLANKLMTRVTNYFDIQIRTTIASGQRARQIASDLSRSSSPNRSRSASQTTAQGTQSPRASTGSNEPMNSEQLIIWYGGILESMKQRYRKLQRLSRVLTRRLSNSAEYSLDDVPMELLVAALVETEHCLVYTQSFEADATYIVAPAILRDQPDQIARILTEAFEVNEAADERSGLMGKGDDRSLSEEEPGYLLVLTPRTPFLWNGTVLMLKLPKVELDLADNRVRLVADGPMHRLALAKQVFSDIFLLFNEDMEPVPAALPPLTCIIEHQAHLPTVNHELQKIGRAANRLAESIVDSVQYVRAALQVPDGYQELIQSWYAFASEHDQHLQKYMDRASSTKFHQLLIELAISWVSFICDDCDPNDRRTFRWAIVALEFTLNRSRRGNIIQMPGEQFEMLRQKVASCMTLLISHFDILGARSSVEAEKEKKLREEMVAHDRIVRLAHNDDLLLAEEDATNSVALDDHLRMFWERIKGAVSGLEIRRSEMGMDRYTTGRVLDEGVEDRSLVFLAGSSANVAIRWQQGNFIGAGSFGSVYLAVNLENGTLMAVKEIKFQQAAGLSSLYNQIKDELSVMQTLRHPNVVEYYGIEVHRDKVYIFEEYCQGGSLAALLEHGRIEDESIMQVYTMQMLEGLAYLHSMNVVHRDIKPDNILLDHQGVIKYVDFGAAKILAKNGQTIRLSRSAKDVGPPAISGTLGTENSLTGTPMYMSPEVIRNDKQGRYGAMDIWSLGCVVLECATGQKPWCNLDNEWAIMFHIGIATQHPPLPDPKQLSELGIDFIRQCLTISPEQRPTAFELMEHPWMLDFQNMLQDMETADLTPSVAIDTPPDPA